MMRLDEEGVRVVYGIPTDARVLERGVWSRPLALANMSDTDNTNPCSPPGQSATRRW